MTRRGTVIAVAVTSMLVAACSSTGDSASTIPTTQPTVVTTTEPDPTTTVAPTTTQPPTTTIDPAETLAADVEADFRTAYDLGKQASQDPFNSELEQAALDFRIGVIRDGFEAKLAEYRSKNYAIRPNDEIQASITIEVPASLIPPSSDVVEMQVCEVDSWIKVELGAGPNGGDAVINPDITAYRSTIYLRSISGTWRYEGGNEISRWEGATECPAE